jgi:hypothetical protein
MENHIVCGDPQCSCQGDINRSGHRNRIMVSTVMQRINEFEQGQQAKLE